MDLVRSIAGPLCRFVRRFSRSPKPEESDAQRLGREGEKLAVRFLRRRGYKILYRNFRGPNGGEVDLVCRDCAANTLVFVEVKTRSSLAFGSPSEAVTLSKQKLIIRGALAWLQLLRNPEIVARFDVVEIVVGEVTEYTLIRDAFQLPEPLIY